MDKNKIIESKINLIMEEHRRVHSKTQLISNAIIRDFQIFIAFLAVILAISVKWNENEPNEFINLQTLIVFAPFLIFIFALFYLLKLSHSNLYAIYMQYIERKINNIFDDCLLNLDTIVIPLLLLKWNGSFIMGSVFFCLSFIVMYTIPAYISYYYILTTHSSFINYKPLIGISYLICIAIVISILIIMLIERKTFLTKIIKLTDQAKSP